MEIEEVSLNCRPSVSYLLLAVSFPLFRSLFARLDRFLPA